MKQNEVIDKLIGVLTGLKTKNKKRFTVRYPKAVVAFEVNFDENRMSILEVPGNTELKFTNRRVETMEYFAKAILEAVNIAKNYDFKR